MAKPPFSELKELSIAERIQLAEDLWDSIVDDPDSLPLTQAQQEEIRRRLEEHAEDPSSALPWEEVRKQLRDRFGA